jgi:hypothetical protein
MLGTLRVVAKQNLPKLQLVQTPRRTSLNPRNANHSKTSTLATKIWAPGKAN